MPRTEREVERLCRQASDAIRWASEVEGRVTYFVAVGTFCGFVFGLLVGSL